MEIKKKKEKKVLEIRISLWGRIICNTRKMLFFELIIALYYL